MSCERVFHTLHSAGLSECLHLYDNFLYKHICLLSHFVSLLSCKEQLSAVQNRMLLSLIQLLQFVTLIMRQ